MKLFKYPNKYMYQIIGIRLRVQEFFSLLKCSIFQSRSCASRSLPRLDRGSSTLVLLRMVSSFKMVENSTLPGLYLSVHSLPWTKGNILAGFFAIILGVHVNENYVNMSSGKLGKFRILSNWGKSYSQVCQFSLNLEMII